VSTPESVPKCIDRAQFPWILVETNPRHEEPTTMNDEARRADSIEANAGGRDVLIETSEAHTQCAAYRILVESPDAVGPRDVDALPSLVAREDLLYLDADTLDTVQPDAAAQTLRFERLDAERGGSLLMLVPRGLDVRVNGLPCPRVALLRVADQVQVAHAILHVTRERDGVARRPSPKQLGRKCPVCGVAIQQSGDRLDDADLLQCSSLTCPDCDSPVEIGTGLVFTPEL
jgi:hypothetical protein